ncbi:MAG: hypothetical protein MN733_31850, partial [Nitrososphaera sp.]|nr:hypothetical protein [Nitrososphaera sp.]
MEGVLDLLSQRDRDVLANVNILFPAEPHEPEPFFRLDNHTWEQWHNVHNLQFLRQFFGGNIALLLPFLRLRAISFFGYFYINDSSTRTTCYHMWIIKAGGTQGEGELGLILPAI